MRRILFVLTLAILFLILTGCPSIQKGHTLTIGADSPGVTVVVDGEKYTTPVSLLVSEGLHTIEVVNPTAEIDFSTKDASELAETSYEFTGWSDGDVENPRTLEVLSDTRLDILTATKYLVYTYSNPYGLVTIPGSGFYVAGSVITLNAPHVDGYAFDKWYVNNVVVSQDETLQLKVDGMKIVIGSYKKASSDTILKVNTKPYSELKISIDGSEYPSPKSLYVENGSSHTIGVTSPQYRDISSLVPGDDVLLSFKSWTDGSTEQKRNVVVNDTVTYTAEFDVSYKVQVEADPDSVVIDGTGWYPANGKIQLSAPALEEYLFDHWEVNGSSFSSENTVEITVDSPKLIKAIYQKNVSTKQLTVKTLPDKLKVTIDGNTYEAPVVVTVEEGTVHTVNVEQVQEKDESTFVSGSDTRYVFTEWNDGSTELSRILTVSSDIEVTAQFSTEYKVDISESPAGIATISGEGWYASGQNVTLSAPSVSGYTFDHWEINGVNLGSSNPLTTTVSKPLMVKAVYSSSSALPAPTDLKLYGSVNTQILLSWKDNATNEDGYEIWRKVEGGTYQRILKTGPNVYVMYDFYPVAGKTNYYKVRAFKKDGTYSDFSNEVSTAGDEPSSVPDPTDPIPANGAVNQDTSLVLQWSVGSSNPSDYRYDVYIGKTTSPSLYAADLESTKIAVTLDPNTKYYWKIVVRSGSEKNEGPLWSFTTGSVVKTGVFKIANSWGIGGWEKVPDGFFYITYEAVKMNRMGVFIVAPKQHYEPKAVAVFKISHPNRGDMKVYVGVGDPSTTAKIKVFNNFYMDGGDHPYPDNKIVLDITELLPIDNQPVFLKVYDGTEYETGTIEYFAVEIYNDYKSGVPVAKYEASGLPVSTSNGKYTYVTIPNVSAVSFTALSTGLTDGIKTSKITELELKKLKESFGVYEGGVNYNVIIDGHGTGYIPPTEEQWQEIMKTAKIISGIEMPTTALPSAVDHSQEIYFPPIGNQGNEGSCTSWTIGYYISTYYEAKENGWDLSGATYSYSGIDSAHLDKVMSPDFLYHQVNNGIDAGSYFEDNIKVISQMGIASWKTMPYSSSDHYSWPSEQAWREAPLHRNTNAKIYYMTISDDDDIKTLKALIANGYVVSIGIDAYQFSSLKSNDVWDIDNYWQSTINHAVTIVGYDDSM
ncbi:InlB B-repeat-containing protein [Kosmotoga pacifica]|uniref:InlB B-repeat-containing protein n=1 Tax=Kosmotoga pacifica TaxID=1330330 RepID=UPI000699EDFC|nr:C1 family peptidase [Kosmotoga pacifica]